MACVLCGDLEQPTCKLVVLDLQVGYALLEMCKVDALADVKVLGCHELAECFVACEDLDDTANSEASLRGHFAHIGFT